MWLSMSMTGPGMGLCTSIEFGSGRGFMLSVMGVWGQTSECFRRLVLSKAGVRGPSARPFDSAQDERPHPSGFRFGGREMTLDGFEVNLDERGAGDAGIQLVQGIPFGADGMKDSALFRGVGDGGWRRRGGRRRRSL